MPAIDPLDGIARYFRVYLPKTRQVSYNTYVSYNDSVRLYLPFLAGAHAITPDALSWEHFTRDSIIDFLQHLQDDRGNGPSTCNQRLSALRGLFAYLAEQDSGLHGENARVQQIKRKPVPKAPPPSLSQEQISAISAQIDPSTKQGARDGALICFLSETGARASEASAVTVGDLDLDHNTVLLHGKGQRDRVMPLKKAAKAAIVHCLEGRDEVTASTPLFQSQRGGALSRFGIYSRVKEYSKSALSSMPSLGAQRVSPHIFRHSLVLRLLDADVQLPTIASCMGHQDISTTQAYAHISVSRKRAALEQVESPGENAAELPQWRPADIMAELQAMRDKALCREKACQLGESSEGGTLP
jgi:integrase/recombinase XerD